MYKVKIYSIGKTKEKWLEDALKEYIKRLSSDMLIEWVFPRDNADLEKFLEKEKEFFCLAPDGAQLDSLGFATFIEKEFINHGTRLCFVIGGPEGIPSSISSRASHALSLSKLTFTHQIARLILVEQLYRALQIQKGTQYHK